MSEQQGERLSDDNSAQITEMRRDAKRAYHKFEQGRPPFSYEPRELYEPDCMYDEAREDAVFEIEKEVFEAAEKMPKPKHKVLEKAYGKLKEAERKFDQNIITVQEQIRKKMAKAGVQVEQDHPWARETTRAQLMKAKNEYLQGLKCYCDIARRIHLANSEPNEAQVMDDLFEKTDMILIAHTTYATIRSYIHHEVTDPAILREDESLTVQHLYTTSIHTINRYLARIHAEKDPQKRKQLWVEMKEDVCVMLLHDWKEDLGHIRPEDMFAILTSLTRPETQWVSLSRDLSTPESSSQDLYFFISHFAYINTEVERLTKHPDKEHRDAHERVQLNHPRSLSNKCRDRINNLATLRYMKGNRRRGENPVQTQMRKIEDSHIFFEIGRGIEQNSEFDADQKEMMRKELQLLCQIALKEIARLSNDTGLDSTQRETLNAEKAFYEAEVENWKA